jgi:hypothetical protein
MLTVIIAVAIVTAVINILAKTLDTLRGCDKVASTGKR